MRRFLFSLVLLLVQPLTTAAMVDVRERGDVRHADDGKPAITGAGTLAERKDADAQYELELMYDDGDGVPRDDLKAIHWHRLAAEQGDADAQYNLGSRYITGLGVPRDYVKSYMWYSLAVANGSEEARFGLWLISLFMTSAQEVEARGLARNR